MVLSSSRRKVLFRVKFPEGNLKPQENVGELVDHNGLNFF